jgi:hypothetical protein
MAKLSGWAKQAGNQGAVKRRTPPSCVGDDPGTHPGEDPARLAATVGLVSPPGEIVLWDEWLAALDHKGDGDHPETCGKSAIPAEKTWLQRKKEVSADQKQR